ncbi:MAG: hypothetical protein JOZ69_07850, partial [Myxococcales bacterium]|nr:hypothetical protein [Myxococcales bacterium]
MDLGADVSPLSEGVYWLCRTAGIAIVPDVNGRLTGISLADGAVRWRLDPAGQVAVDGPPAKPSLVAAGVGDIRTYALIP